MQLSRLLRFKRNRYILYIYSRHGVEQWTRCTRQPCKAVDFRLCWKYSDSSPKKQREREREWKKERRKKRASDRNRKAKLKRNMTQLKCSLSLSLSLSLFSCFCVYSQDVPTFARIETTESRVRLFTSLQKEGGDGAILASLRPSCFAFTYVLVRTCLVLQFA